MKKITATDLLNLLKNKHANDVFIPQCKTGSTWVGKYQVIDAWVMARSWAHPITYGYEIKVNRSDFINDNKWQGYLEYCNELYFVCPPKLINPSEVSEDVGLLWSSQNCTRLYTKKKAPWRNVEIPENLYRYILITRMHITKCANENEKDSKKKWEEWLAKKEVNRSFGNMLGKKLRQVIDEKIIDVSNENEWLKRENAKLNEVKEFLNKLHVNIYSYRLENHIRDRLSQFDAGISQELLQTLKNAYITLENTLKVINATVRK